MLFAEHLIECTPQTSRHSAIADFPVVKLKTHLANLSICWPAERYMNLP